MRHLRQQRQQQQQRQYESSCPAFSCIHRNSITHKLSGVACPACADEASLAPRRQPGTITNVCWHSAATHHNILALTPACVHQHDAADKAREGEHQLLCSGRLQNRGRKGGHRRGRRAGGDCLVHSGRGRGARGGPTAPQARTVCRRPQTKTQLSLIHTSTAAHKKKG